ncbi:MAG: DUF3570 domain-containing protein [Gammaproteobacteria bacterium]|nr:DUF3570 domain-containing protein [Gammaproteobacteria bacterium]
MARKAAPGAAVAATRTSFALALIWLAGAAAGAILPEDRTDVLYHSYSGGGLEVDGPSILVRKGFKDSVSVWGNYYVDLITSASIDVVTTASPYQERRDEQSIGVDYLHGKTFLGLSYLKSDEDDYASNAARFGISQDFFGDLTTLAISYAYGWDEVRRNGDDAFFDEAKRQAYRVDLSQIMTRNMIVSVNYETISDEGFLNNPYRSVRYADSTSALGYSYEAEIYPRTRTSNAVAIRAKYFLPYRAALKVEYRHYNDTWGINAFNSEIEYIHPLPKGITLEVKYRYYDQTSADFYSDLFERQQAQNFLARDKELATFTTHTAGIGLSWQFDLADRIGFLKRGEISAMADYIRFSYDDFRDLRTTGVTPGTEPLYEFDSLVLRIFVSFWY